MKHVIRVISIFILLLALLGCPFPVQETEILSTLTLNFSMNGEARTLLPEIDMDVADYYITGTGPDGEDFEISTPAGSVNIPGLAFGEWTVIVQAINADRTVIGRGAGTTTLHSGENSYLEITVTPLDGYGTFDLTILWNAEDIERPSIEAQIITLSGSEVDFDFTITGGNTGTRKCTIPTGYYTFTLKLLDNGLLTMGIGEVVRIVKDETTFATFKFYDINKPGGTIKVNITQKMADPLLVLLSGAEATRSENQSMALSASVRAYTGKVAYVWFVNGDLVSKERTFSFDNSWAQGYYRIDATAYSVYGSQAGSDSVFIEVTEPAAATGFQTVWKTDNNGSSDDNQITLPLASNGTYDFTVNWGDGNTDIITTYNQAETTHTYAASGTYDVTISGEIVGWSFYPNSDPQKILEIIKWGPLGFGNTTGQFHGCTNLTISADDMPDLTGTVSFQDAFRNCNSLVTIPGISGWDTSSVTRIDFMFFHATAFNGDLSEWDTSSVTDMRLMFYQATAFNGDLSKWDTSSVTDMSLMFYKATAFNGDLSEWDTSSVTDMGIMFHQATAFNGDLSEWDTSSVTNMRLMFYKATAFNGDLSSWDISNVTSMGYMFRYVTLSTASYDSLLTGWEGQSVQNEISFHGGNSKYSSGSAADARRRLIDDHNWEISDGGQE